MSAIRAVDTRGMVREQWLQARRYGIGGSDAAAVAGLNPWKSPIEVYLEKTGEISYEEPASEAVYWGRQLEDLIAREFVRRTGLRVRRCNAILQHPEHRFMIANIDRQIIGCLDGPGILECKTANAFAKDDWKDGNVPPYYLIQVQHYLAVTGYRWAHIAVLLGGNEFRHTKVERDDELISYLVDIEREFWTRVERRDPPPIDGSEASAELLKRMYPEGKAGMSVNLPSEACKLIAEYQLAKQEEKAAAQRAESAANRLKAMLGDAELGYVGNYVVSWKQIRSSRFDSNAFKADYPELHDRYLKESSYRTFQVTNKESE